MSKAQPANFRSLAEQRDRIQAELVAASEAISGSIATSDLASLRKAKTSVLELSEALVGCVGELRTAMEDAEAAFIEDWLPRHRQASLAGEVEQLNSRQTELDTDWADLRDRLAKGRQTIAALEGSKLRFEGELFDQRKRCDQACGLALRLHGVFILGTGR